MNNQLQTIASKYKKFNLVILINCMLICGLITLYLGKDFDWDLANYHYYNPFAFFNNRYDKDFWPTYLNTYLNPTIDFLTYFLINTFPPKLVGFTMGAIHGITVWLLFKMAELFLPKKNSSFYIAIVIAIIGAYCPHFIHGLGMFPGDITVGIFVLASSYTLCKNLFETNKTFLWLLSGLFLGFALGLKLTTGFYCIGSLLALLILYLSKKSKIHFNAILYWILGTTTGLIITAGHWMVFLWNKFHNPVFPFYNKIFQSDYFTIINWHHLRFFSKEISEFVLYPFFFAFKGHRVADFYFTDVRFAILYALFVLLGVGYVISFFKKDIKIVYSTPEKWLFFFIVFSYIFWEISFSILRYAVILEMLTPLIIFMIVSKISQGRLIRGFGITTIFIFIILSTSAPFSHRSPWGADNYFGIKTPSFLADVNKAMVLFPAPTYLEPYAGPFSPLAYLIPSLPASWSFLGVPYTNEKDILSVKINERISHHEGPFYLLSATDTMNTFKYMLLNFNLISNHICYEIETTQNKRKIERKDKPQRKVFLCQLTKIPDMYESI